MNERTASATFDCDHQPQGSQPNKDNTASNNEVITMSKHKIIGLHELCKISIEHANEITSELGAMLSEIGLAPDRITDIADKYGGEGVFAGMSMVLINSQIRQDAEDIRLHRGQNPELN